MQARFLLGPAGSGKTFRCCAEIRAELRAQPAGPPLIFLAPKQATFQIERQLLASGELNGYARLHILSFERLAEFIFERLELSAPELLSEAGRVMVLRALLARHHGELKIFRSSARLTGFAAQLSLLLREFQRSRVTPERLQSLAGKISRGGRLNDKLHDLALLLGKYEDWLAERRAHGEQLDDANRLLDLATEALQLASAAGRRLDIGALWLDGFAEMTPQEQVLLATLMPHCSRATLAFCLAGEPGDATSWLTPWAVVGRTFARCRDSLAHVPGCAVTVEVIAREDATSRFAGAPALAQLERELVSTQPRSGTPVAVASETRAPEAIRLVACPQAEAEATLAARAIVQHVQAGGRYRECAVLVRSLPGYGDVLRRTLERYQIPFFLDQREPVAHHPLAELTRYALRTVAFDWQPEDWFGALETGLARVAEEEVDRLENEALRRGWEGGAWRVPLVTDDVALGAVLEQIRRRAVPPFEALAGEMQASGYQPTGRALATAIRALWLALDLEAQLEVWGKRAAELEIKGAEHGTVWTQLNDWLDNLELAFADEALALRDWLPILEAGLAGMTVGVIPPMLDQVLVGSVDRSRNPDLQIVFVLGVNEGVFPAPPKPGVLLTEMDRSEIEAQGILLGLGQRQLIGHERYFGYIAFTRARKQLVVTWATADADGRELNPSPFIAAIRRAVPEVAVENYLAADWPAAVHRDELPPFVLAQPDALGPLARLAEFAPLLSRQRQSQEALGVAHLDTEVAGRLYGGELATSVSALEDFTACPFHFLAARGLRAQEREEFVVDGRAKGSFQHEVLQKFHERVQGEQRNWRDLAPGEARALVREIGAAVALEFRGGLFAAGAPARFTADVLTANLEQLMATLVGWAPHCDFNPTAVEVSFGLPGAQLPPWRIELPHGQVLLLRGRIDRVDLCRTAGGEALVVICDYKSGGKQMDEAKLEHGLELQLLSYLAALSQMPAAGVFFGVDRMQPAGVFYIPLRAKVGSGATRAEADELAANVSAGFQHRGRFDGACLARFDNRGATKGEQFRFKLNQDGAFAKTGNEALPPGQFPDLVAAAETKLRDIGERIFRGEAAVSPYRLKQQTACDLCAYRAVCRFDPWTMTFRRLKENQE